MVGNGNFRKTWHERQLLGGGCEQGVAVSGQASLFSLGGGGTSASPRVWRPAAGAMRGGGGEASSRPAHVHIQREFTWHSCVAERRLVSRSSSSPSFEEVIQSLFSLIAFPLALGLCFSHVCHSGGAAAPGGGC